MCTLILCTLCIHDCVNYLYIMCILCVHIMTVYILYAQYIQIFEARKQCEIDSTKLTDADNKDVNMVSTHILSAPQYLFPLHSLLLHLHRLPLHSLLLPLFLSSFCTSIRPSIQANLLFFIEKVLSAITSSARSCPRLMCKVFAMLREAAVHKFPGEG